MRIRLITPFERQLKRLAKKYASLSGELRALNQLLLLNPTLGTPLGNNCYKIRLAIASKGKGKSGGARVITYVQLVGETVFLLAIYDKSEQASISAQELAELVQSVDE